MMIDDARNLLSRFIESRMSITPHIRMIPTADAPNTWDELRSVDLSTGLPVWNGASESSIYIDSDHNVMFRYWHDLGHLRYDKSFTPEDEIALQWQYHMRELWYWLAREDYSDAHNLAMDMYVADTIGQIEYAQVHHDFPADQLAFVNAYVANKQSALKQRF